MKRVLMLLLVGCIAMCAIGCEKKDSDCPPLGVEADSLDGIFECLVIAKTGEYEKDKRNYKNSYEFHKLGEINIITVPNFNYEKYELKSVVIYKDNVENVRQNCDLSGDSDGRRNDAPTGFIHITDQQMMFSIA